MWIAILFVTWLINSKILTLPTYLVSFMLKA